MTRILASIIILISLSGHGIAAFATSGMRSAKIVEPLAGRQRETLRFRRTRSMPPLQYRDGTDDTAELVSHNINSKKEATGVPSDETGAQSFPPPITVLGLARSQALALFLTTLAIGINLVVSGHGLVDMNSIHWNGSPEFFSLWDFQLTPLRLLEGILAAMPMIYLGNTLEHSARRDTSRVNFSTTNMVMMLFGRRKHDFSTNESNKEHMLSHENTTFRVLGLALCLALVTGLSEEIMFRGVIPSAFQSYTHSILFALYGQALLFGLGHMSPQVSLGENAVMGGFQAVNGLWAGLVYLMTGGDVLPCIIAHFLYDSHVFMETWHTANNQMDYTEQAVRQKLTAEEEKEIRKIKQEAGPSLSAETLAFARRFFYAFDYDHRGSLAESDVQRAISFAFLHDTVQPTEEQVQEMFDRLMHRREQLGTQVSDDLMDRVKLHEFLRILFLLKVQAQAA